MMEEIHKKVLLAVLGAIISGSLSSIVTGAIKDNSHEIQIERLAKESKSKENHIELIEGDFWKLNEECNSLTENYKSLQSNYNNLSEKYEKCISSDSSITVIESTDGDSYTRYFRTGDMFEFRLLSTSMFLRIVRVTDRGPIVEFSGCDNYLANNVTEIETIAGLHYLLQPQQPMEITFTSESCVDNATVGPPDLEGIVLIAKSHDVDEQTVLMEYFRDFSFR
jgi:hypothetical protein